MDDKNLFYLSNLFPFIDIENEIYEMGATASQSVGHYQPSFGTFYELKAVDIDGNERFMSDFRGKVLMVVNVASSCGKTDREYKRLVDLYSRYHSQGFEILAFP